jgi:predicted RND superfamily exporter protein
MTSPYGARGEKKKAPSACKDLARLDMDDRGASQKVEDVDSLANADCTVGGSGYFEVRRFLESIPEGKKEPGKLKREALRNPLCVKNLISEDARTSAIIVHAYDKPSDPHYRRRPVDKVHDMLARHKNQIDRFYLAGRTTTSLRLSRSMNKDVSTFIPITYLLITLTIRFVFRNLRLTPRFLTSLTTAIGFLSLVAREIRAIREFAFIVSAGMIFEFFYSFFLLPPSFCSLIPTRSMSGFRKVGERGAFSFSWLNRSSVTANRSSLAPAFLFSVLFGLRAKVGWKRI